MPQLFGRVVGPFSLSWTFTGRTYPLAQAQVVIAEDVADIGIRLA